jgi:ribosomal protein S17E
MEDKYVVLMSLIQSMCASVYALEGEPSNMIQQKEVNNNVANIVQYAVDHSQDKETINIIYNTLVETYMRVISMDFDTIKDVIDTLTMARMIIRNIVEEHRHP